MSFFYYKNSVDLTRDVQFQFTETDNTATDPQCNDITSDTNFTDVNVQQNTSTPTSLLVIFCILISNHKQNK